MIYQNEIFGGVLIGLASVLPLLFEGRIAGVSGYAASALRPQTSDGRSGFLFVIGLVLGGLACRALGSASVTESSLPLSLWLWAVAGLLVGFGSRLGGGCTSGHGVCGLGRGSPRSMVSVAIFMGTAMIVTFFIRSFA